MPAELSPIAKTTPSTQDGPVVHRNSPRLRGILVTQLPCDFHPTSKWLHGQSPVLFFSQSDASTRSQSRQTLGKQEQVESRSRSYAIKESFFHHMKLY